MAGKAGERDTLLNLLVPREQRQLREEAEASAAFLAKIAALLEAAEREALAGPARSELPDRAEFTGKVLPADLAEFITGTSSTANTFVHSSAVEIGELIGKNLDATEPPHRDFVRIEGAPPAEPRRASSVGKSE